MKKIIYPLLSVMLIACGDFNDINLNPDTPTMVTPDFLATRVILNTTDSPASKWLFGSLPALPNTWNGICTINSNAAITMLMPI